MAGEQVWANVSFTPTGEPTVFFGEAGVTFPGWTAHADYPAADIDPEDIVGPITIRIQPSNTAAVPTFPKGQKGTLQGTRPDGVTYTVSNATVIDSKPGDLVLSSVSVDGATSPISTSVWLERLGSLVDDVQTWAAELGWDTRRTDKRMEDTQIGAYDAPALRLQRDFTRVLLEPIARSAPGADGVVDLYLTPAYDDIASLYHYGGGWHIHYRYAGSSAVATLRDAKSKPLSKETLGEVLEEISQHAA